MSEAVFTLVEAIERLIQNSHFTVKNGHAWTKEDHSLLSQVLRQATRTAATEWINTVGMTFYVLGRATPLAKGSLGITLLGASLTVEGAQALRPEYNWMAVPESLQPLVSAGLGPFIQGSPDVDRMMGIWELKLGGAPKTDEYLGYG